MLTQEKTNVKPTNKLPDGPTMPPLFQLWQWMTRPLEFLDECSAKYGETFTVRFLGFEPLVMVSHPEALKEIFTAKPNQFDSGKANEIMRPFLGNNSLIVLDGKPHQRQRKLLMPPFHGHRMKAYGQLIGQITKDVIQQWKVGQKLKTRKVMQEITLRVMLQAVFGLDQGERYHQLKPLLDASQATFTTPLGSSLIFISALQKDLGAWSPWGKYIRRQQQIDQILYAEIQDRQENPQLNGDDILSLMLAARDEAGQPMTKEELRDELLTLVSAGHDSTATALAWAIYCITQKAEVRDKILDEVQALGETPDPMDIVKLPYLNAVVCETLRMYPVTPVAFPRIAKTPIEIQGRLYEAGTTLFPALYLAHRREELYPQPQEFRPERFLGQKFSQFEYCPFGGGNRGCIGMAFAPFEMKLILATVLSHWRLDLISKTPIKPVRLGVTISPQGGVPVQVSRF